MEQAAMATIVTSAVATPKTAGSSGSRIVPSQNQSPNHKSQNREINLTHPDFSGIPLDEGCPRPRS
jgi:hypothetical protein